MYCNREEEAFWLVWNPEGNNPQYRHPNLAAAFGEAERLAKAKPGNTFIVLQTVGARVVDNMVRIDMRPDPIPF